MSNPGHTCRRSGPRLAALAAGLLLTGSGAKTPTVTKADAKQHCLDGTCGVAPRDSALLQLHKPSAKPSNKHLALKKVSLADVGDDTLATCNDGSPGFFYWGPAAEKSRSWLVLLGYGGWCWDADSCALRSPEMSSSTPYGDTWDADPDGILADTSFNRVWAPQCSSDAWMGDIGANESEAGVNWRGARIMRTILRYLTSRRGGLRDGDLLVFGGLSAGARGAMVHLDTLKRDGLVPKGVRLMGFLDSPYYVEMHPFKNNTDIWHRVETQTQQMALSLHNEEILRGHGACGLPEAWQCGFGQFRLQVVRTPYLLIASQYDWYGLLTAEGSDENEDHCFPDPLCSYYRYAHRFARVTRQGVEQLFRHAGGSMGVFSSTCYNHAQSLWEAYTKETVAGASRADAFHQALQAFDSETATMPHIIDTSCDGMNCGSGCLAKLDPVCLCPPDSSASAMEE